jgi:Tol biopolymer transport system component
LVVIHEDVAMKSAVSRFIIVLSVAILGGCSDAKAPTNPCENSTDVCSDSSGTNSGVSLPLPLRDRIVFASDRLDKRYDIFAMKVDGTDLRRLTNSAHGEWCPALSPDGNWIAFYQDDSTWTTTRFSVMLMRGNGTEKRLIENVEPPFSGAACPQWSADSKLFLFPKWRPDADETVKVYSVAGTLVWSVTSRWTGTTSLSPDGSRVAIQTWTPTIGPNIDYKVQVLGANGSTTKPQFGFDPSWSPNGDRVLYSCGTANPSHITGICSAQPDMGSMQVISPAIASRVQSSPDGTTLAYFCFANGKSDVCFSKSSGEPLGNTTGAQAHAGAGTSLFNGLAWSPESLYVAFECASSLGDDICTVRPDGTGFLNLTNSAAVDRSPSISPRSGQ